MALLSLSTPLSTGGVDLDSMHMPEGAASHRSWGQKRGALESKTACQSSRACSHTIRSVIQSQLLPVREAREGYPHFACGN
jgi:hypothetical protein